MREDFRIQNDGRSFSIFSGDCVGSFAELAEVQPFADKEKAIAVDLGADDYFTGRLVVNEDLTPLENSEWIAQIRRPIKVSDGILIAGGCDPDSFHDWLDNQPEKMPEEFREVVPFDIPSGEYVVDIFAYVGSHAAYQAIFVDHGEDEPYKTYSSRWSSGPIPLEVYDEACGLTDLSEHAARLVELVNDESVKVVDFGEDCSLVVSYLFHFTPKSQVKDDLAADQTDENGWLEFQRKRVPDRCPLSIPSTMPASQ